MKKFSNKFWEGAKKVIPGGNLLYSKRAEMFCQVFGRHILQKQKNVICGTKITKDL